MASQPVHLYYWPTSFFSQVALVSLEEKKLTFKRTIVNLLNAEQNEPWFMRINPKGEVPVMKLGDAFISESERIVEAADKLNNAPVLIPDPSTADGKLVQQWRKRFDEINIEFLTFGTLLNPDLITSEMKIPVKMRPTLAEYSQKVAKAIEKLESYREKNPDLREAYETKLEKYRKRSAGYEKSEVVRVMEQLEGVFDDLETRLRKSRQENIIEHWLCGPTFTAADVFLSVLLGRLDFLGLLTRYLNPEKRPAVIEYWNQSQTRPSVKKVVIDYGKELSMYMAKSVMTKVAAGTVVAGGVVALGLFLGHKFNKS